MMKLSENTLSVLKNFATINDNIVFRSGNIQRVFADDHAILGEAELDESFPIEFGIYEFNQFLGNISTMNDPELEFNDTFVTMEDNEGSFCFHGCPLQMIKNAPTKSLELNDPDVTFDLSNTLLTKIIKLANVNSLPHLSIIGEDGKLLLKAHQRGNDTSNKLAIEIGKIDKDFIATIKTENLKVIPDDYEIQVKVGAFTKFTSKSKKITYFIALIK